MRHPQLRSAHGECDRLVEGSLGAFAGHCSFHVIPRRHHSSENRARHHSEVACSQDAAGTSPHLSRRGVLSTLSAATLLGIADPVGANAATQGLGGALCKAPMHTYCFDISRDVL